MAEWDVAIVLIGVRFPDSPALEIFIKVVGSLIQISGLTLFLTITHHSVLQKIFQTSYEHSLWLHKKAGKFSIMLNMLFTLLNVIQYLTSKPTTDSALGNSSVRSFARLISVIVTSVLIFVLARGLKMRKKIYETFYYSHIFSTLVYIPISALSHELKPFLFTVAFGFSVWLIDLLYRVFLFYTKKQGKIVSIQSQKIFNNKKFNQKAISTVEGNSKSKSKNKNKNKNKSKKINENKNKSAIENNSITKNDRYVPDTKVLTIEVDNFQYEPMQWIRLCIPAISKYQMHPITICSPPKFTDKKTGKARFDVLIKNLGDWSKSVVDCPDKLLLDKPVKIEGPLGTSSLSVLDYRYLVLIGGGCGVGPILSLMFTLMELRKSTFGEKLIKIKFFWMVKDFQSLELFQDQLKPVSEQFKKYDIQCYVTRQNKEDFENEYTIPDFVRFGRPKFSHILTETAEEAQKQKINKIGVFACGPVRLIKQIQNDCLDSSNSQIRLDFSREVTKF
ncbi:nadph oxidase [Anaeramoeba flamelloides]|uniref:Nadph oxidase n=1 Tax=Anaeramoeba flamelloides TaxID=1746091 RepID=A0ABQ8X5U2_9EUKA|nr:nadph oxidase [Anaeramoeba flamelloides]